MLADWVERVSWGDELYSIIDSFRSRYGRLHLQPLDCLEDIEIEEARHEAIAALIGELQELLTDHASRSPGPHEVSAAAETEVYEGQHIEAAAIELEVSLEVAETGVSPEEVGLVDMEIEASRSNLYPVEGVLFRVDEVSEAVPSVSPEKLPLYISREVAETALNVANLPLEASADLSSHDRKGTCGVMKSAEINGNDFCVKGVIWPWNHGPKVARIVNARKRLGMSMNARADGDVTVIDGQRVFAVTDLELLGGCILLAQLATWQKTRVAAAAHPDLPNPLKEAQPIAASAQADPLQAQGVEPPMTTNSSSDPVLAQMTALAKGFEQFKTGMSGQVQSLQSTIGDLTSRLATLEQARQAEVQAQAAAQAAAQEQQQQTLLASAIASAISEQLKPLTEKLDKVGEGLPAVVDRAVQQRVNPRGVPPRRVAPIAPGGTAQDLQGDQTRAIELQIAELDGQLKASESRPLAESFTLLDEKRRLQAMLPVSAN